MAMLLIAIAVAALGLAAFLGLRATAPKCKIVHASRANKMVPVVETRWWLAGLVRDDKGRRIPMHNKFLGCTEGNSMEDYGIPNHTRFIADRLTDAARKQLAHDDIVVVSAKAQRSNTGYRLRRVDRVQGDKVSFYPDAKNEGHRTRPLSEVAAKVVYVL